MFNPEFYSNNRRKLASLCPGAIIVIAGNALMQRTGDTAFTFRQDSNLLYLTGLAEPSACLVINTKTGEEFIMLDGKTGTAKIFDGDFDQAEIAKLTGIKEIKSFDKGFDYIVNESNNKVLFNEPRTWNKSEFVPNGFRQSVKRRLLARSILLESVSPQLASLRMIKQPAEIEAITKAVAITKNALQIVESSIRTCNNEAQLLSLINIEFARSGVAHGYEPIVASAQNATTLHYIKNNSDYKLGDPLLFDVGAEVGGYSADISRTFIAGDNKRAKDIIAEVLAVQNELVSFVRPGITWKQLSEKAYSDVGAALMRLGVTNDLSATRTYFPHAIGHFLGLDVHDAGDYTQPLAEGMVITIEPGIYVPEESIGVRIEDDILVTATGSKML